jgi:enoyl-CoA hydratase/carnithine racemase
LAPPREGSVRHSSTAAPSACHTSSALAAALDLILTGREFDVAEAQNNGFVNRVVPAGTGLDAAVELAQHITSHPWNCVLSDRAATYAAFELTTTAALANELRHGENTIFSYDFAKRAAQRGIRTGLKKLKRALPI